MDDNDIYFSIGANIENKEIKNNTKNDKKKKEK